MEQRPFRDYLRRSIQTQLTIWLSENTTFPEVRIVISDYLRAQLLSESGNPFEFHQDQHKETYQETFCGYPLVLDKNMPDNKFELHFLTCNQVRMRVTLTG